MEYLKGVTSSKHKQLINVIEVKNNPAADKRTILADF